MGYREKECLTCKKLFQPKSPTSKYCSQECKNSFISMTRVCIQCNKEFFIGSSKAQQKYKKFCSRKCYHEYSNKNHPELGKTKSKKPMDERRSFYFTTCEYCRKKFYKRQSNNIEGYRDFCSIKCSSEHLKAISRIYVMCDECNEWFELKIKLYNRLKDNKKKIICKDCRKKLGNYSNGQYVSKLEQDFFKDFLLESKQFRRQVNIIKGAVVDFINYENNIIIEINGDYWHANPKFHNSSDIIKMQFGTFTNSQKERFPSLEGI